MSKHELFMKLEDIQYKYERLASLIGIIQMFTAEVVEIAGAPSDSLVNGLYEIELGMVEANEGFKALICEKEDADDKD